MHAGWLTASDDRTAKLWGPKSGECLKARARWFGLTASDARSAKLWDVESGECLETLAGHLGTLKLAASPQDGVRVPTASEDRTAKLRDVERSECLKARARWLAHGLR